MGNPIRFFPISVPRLLLLFTLGFYPAALVSQSDSGDDSRKEAPAEKAAVDRGRWPSPLIAAYPLIGTKEETLARYKPLNDFLAGELEVEIKPLATDGYFPIFVGFAKKTIHFAYMGPLSYVELCNYAKVEPLVMELGPEGQPGYRALIIARADSGLKNLEQAKGKALAMVDPHSTSGFLIPSLHLLKTMGLSPAAFAGKVELTGAHDAAIKGVAEGRFDLAATNDIDLGRARKEQGYPEDLFVILWQSGLYPASPYVVAEDLPASFKKALQQAMLKANQNKEILARLGIGGFVSVKSEDYDSIRELQKLLK